VRWVVWSRRLKFVSPIVLFWAASALAWLVVVAAARRRRGGLYARFVGVLLGILLGGGPARGTGADFGLSMLASGGFTIAAALAFSTRVPGVASDAVLLFAVVSTVLGEWIGPAALRRSLARAGELHAVSAEEAGRPSDAPERLVERESHG